MKALYRRALARRTLTHYKDALADLRVLLDVDSGNQAAKKENDQVGEIFQGGSGMFKLLEKIREAISFLVQK